MFRVTDPTVEEQFNPVIDLLEVVSNRIVIAIKFALPCWSNGSRVFWKASAVKDCN